MSDGNRARWLWPLGIGLVVAALVVVALAREPVQLDPATPEGTVQGYLQAISDRDYHRAFGMLDPDGFDGCTAADLARNAPRDPFTATLNFSEDAESFRPIARTSGEFVSVVDVTLRFGTGGVLGGSWDQYETFYLISEDGVWRITDDPYPWPYFANHCNREDF